MWNLFNECSASNGLIVRSFFIQNKHIIIRASMWLEVSIKKIVYIMTTNCPNAQVKGQV